MSDLDNWLESLNVWQQFGVIFGAAMGLVLLLVYLGGIFVCAKASYHEHRRYRSGYERHGGEWRRQAYIRAARKFWLSPFWPVVVLSRWWGGSQPWRLISDAFKRGTHGRTESTSDGGRGETEPPKYPSG